MKKILSFALAGLMIFACMTSMLLGTVAAEDEEQELIVWDGDDADADVGEALPGDNAKDEGWYGRIISGGYKHTIDLLELDDRLGAAVTYPAASTESNVEYRFHYEIEPVDITPYKFVEFDIYVSNPAKFNEDMLFFEICSATYRDQYEIDFSGAIGWKAGWNHVKIEISKMRASSGATIFDPTQARFFYFMFGNSSLLATEEDAIVAIDDIKFTKGFEALKGPFDEKYADLIADLAALGEYTTSSKITPENIAQVKRMISDAEMTILMMSETEKGVFDEAGYEAGLKRAKSSLEKYEEKQQRIEETVAQNQTLVDTINGFPTELNNANYETTKTAVEKARADFDALVRSVREDLEDAGVLAKLEAAEKLVRDYVPTDEPEDNTPTDQKPASGCASALSIGAGAMLLLAGAWVGVNARKKEN